MVKKKSAKRLLQLECDRKMQQWGRLYYKECLACGGKYNCLHHYFTKGSSAALRYDKKNLIPICQSCHYKHHKVDNPTVHNNINDKKGKKWRDDLVRRQHDYVKTNMQYYRNMIEYWTEEINKLKK